MPRPSGHAPRVNQDTTVQAELGRSVRRVQATAGRIAVGTAVAALALAGPALAAREHGSHSTQPARASISLRSVPARVSVQGGRSATSRVRIRTTVRNRAVRSVSFRATGLPSGATAIFKPATVKRGHASTMLLTTSSSTRPGSYTLRIWAISGKSHLNETLRQVRRTAPTAARLAVRVKPVSPTKPPPPSTTSSQAAGSAPSHVSTWAYDDGCNGGTGATPALVQQWVTYAEANCGPGGQDKPVSDCHAGGVTYCKVMQYLDTNLIYNQYSSAELASFPESYFLHEPAGTTRVTSPNYDGGYLMNQTNSGYQAYWKNYVDENYSNVDGLFMDDQSPSTPFYGLSSTSSAEITTSAAYQAAHADMSGALTTSSGASIPQVDNTIPDCGNPYESAQGVGPTGNMIAGTVQGLVAEGCPESNGTLSPYYAGLLDDMAYVDDETSGFTVPLSYGAQGASYQDQSRLVQEATILLGFSPGHIVDWADLEQGSNDLAVWPEEGIYPTSPVQSMSSPGGNGCLTGAGSYCPTGGHNDLEVTSGIYRREFAQCYNQGVASGPCAAIVNTTSSPVTVKSSWLTNSYSHEITLSGGDVQSGGTISLAGTGFTAGSTSVAADSAVLLHS